MTSTATFSPDGVHRYTLWRDVASHVGPTAGYIRWVMLNPSTADASTDDPTIRRCMGFTRLFGATGMEVMNLHSYRATDPGDLLDAISAGIDTASLVNATYLATWDQDDGPPAKIVVGWGAHRAASEMVVKRAVAALHEITRDLWCLGTTKTGAPRHPLYLRGDTPLIRWAS